MGWKATGETGKGVTVEEGEALHSGCALEENVKLQESAQGLQCSTYCRCPAPWWLSGAAGPAPALFHHCLFPGTSSSGNWWIYSVFPTARKRHEKLPEDRLCLAKQLVCTASEFFTLQCARLFMGTAGASGTCSASHPYLDQWWRDKPHLLSRLMSGLREMPWPCH